MTDLPTLVRLLEEAEEGSEELDVAVTKFLHNYGPDQPLWYTLEWTRNLQHALSLVPEEWSYICMERYSDGWYVRLKRMSADHEHVVANQKPAALALCIAALRAREQTATETRDQHIEERQQD